MKLPLPAPDDGLAIILKLAGDACNINCTYCYEKRKPIGDVERMSPALLRALFAKAKGRALALELHGGEPLVVGKPHMRELLRECRRYPGPLRVACQTNATLLDDDWISLFEDEFPALELATSLDGDPIASRYRVDYKDRAVHLAVEAAFALCERRGFSLGVVATIARSALGRARELLDYFSRFAAIRFIKVNPCFDFNASAPYMPHNRRVLPVSGTPQWGIHPAEFAQFLCELFDLWIDEDRPRLLIEPFLSILRTTGGASTTFCVYDARKCAHQLTLYPDGRLASCDELKLDDALLARTLDDVASLDDVIGLQTASRLHADLDDLLVKCETCTHQDTCRGGCLATRKRYRGSPHYEAYCDYRKHVIDHVRHRVHAAHAAELGGPRHDHAG